MVSKVIPKVTEILLFLVTFWFYESYKTIWNFIWGHINVTLNDCSHEEGPLFQATLSPNNIQTNVVGQVSDECIASTVTKAFADFYGCVLRIVRRFT